MYTLLKGKAEGLHDELVDFTRNMLQTPSLSLQEQDMAGTVRAEMERLGYDRVVQDGTGNIAGFMLGMKGHPTVLLKSHMDTVSPVSSDWSFDPYEARVHKNRIYGVGAADCKSGVAAQIYAGALLKRAMLPLEGNVIVAAAVAEENGKSLGLRSLLNQTLPEWELYPDHVILGEPTNLGLYYGHEGWADFEIQLCGQDETVVHEAVNAISNELQELAAVEHPGQREEVYMSSPSFQNVDDGSSAQLHITRRLHESETVNDVLNRMRHEAQVLTQSEGMVSVDVQVAYDQQKLFTDQSMTVRNAVEPWKTDPYDPLVERSRQILLSAGCPAQPGTWQLQHLGMGTAGSVLNHEFNLPTVGYGPGDENVAHGADEYVSIENLDTAVYGTASIVHGLVGVPVFGWTSDDI